MNGAQPTGYYEAYSVVHDRTLNVSASGVLTNGSTARPTKRR
jgi:hypothetical protein